MSKELPAQVTQVKNQDMLYALANAWIELFHEQPKKESLLVLLAQGALETGQFKKMWCYNIGNIKSVEGDGRDYTYYKCNEILKRTSAEKLVKSADNDGGPAQITSISGDNATIWFFPKNKYCKFRAFESLHEGAIDYLGFLHRRFNSAWSAVLSGNPQQFSHLLKLKNYYTADEKQYTKGVMALFNQFNKLEYDTNSLPVLSEYEKQQVLNMINLTSQELIEK